MRLFEKVNTEFWLMTWAFICYRSTISKWCYTWNKKPWDEFSLSYKELRFNLFYGISIDLEYSRIID